MYNTIYGPEWLKTIPGATDKLTSGESIIVGNKVYAVCSDCLSVVQVNKAIFGSLHHCNRIE